MVSAKRKIKETKDSINDLSSTVKNDPQVDIKRNDRIAKAAYYKAEKRGFAPGYEEQDWLAAEAEIDENTVTN